MTDLSLTIAPKSDQLNADDLINGPRTVTITKVAANPAGADQPISIYFEGDGGKPYRPCKIMRRLLVMVWGKEGAAYAGRSMTLYRDPAVLWGGIAVGGIRISHMSHLESQMTVALAESKKVRKPYTVRPLATPKPQQEQKQSVTLADWIAATLKPRLDACKSVAEIEKATGGKAYKAAQERATEAEHAQMQAMVDGAIERVGTAVDGDDDTFPGDLPSQQDAEA